MICTTLIYENSFNIITSSVCVVQEAAAELVTETFESHMKMLPMTRDCPVCGKTYKSYITFREHLVKQHPHLVIEDRALEADDDMTHQHTKQLLRLLIIKRAMDISIHNGDGERLSLIMKQTMLYFKEAGNTKYALACFEHVAMIQYCLSPYMKELVVHECFVNNLGRIDTNLPMDLDLEHQNKFFKDHFTLNRSEPSKKVLDRLSLAQSTVQTVLTNFEEGFGLEHHSKRRVINEEAHNKDVKKLYLHLKEKNVGIVVPGRKHKTAGLSKACHDPLERIDMFALKQWMYQKYKELMDQPFLS